MANIKSLSARAFSVSSNIPLGTVTRAADRLGIQKAGSADNSPLLLTPEAQCRILEFHTAELTARTIRASNETIRIAGLIVALAPLTGSKVFTDAAKASLAEHEANKRAIGTSTEPSTVAHARLNGIIAGFKGVRLL